MSRLGREADDRQQEPRGQGGLPVAVRSSEGLGVGALERGAAGARLRRMNARVDHLLHEALGLPDDERSALVVALLDSLEGANSDSVSEAWRLEILRRRDELRAGRVAPVAWSEAKARLAAL